MDKYILYAIILILILCIIFLYIYFRRKFVRFSDAVCEYAEAILKGNNCDDIKNQESLTSKMVMELEKIRTILNIRYLQAKNEKEELQVVISDIAHQLKIPLSNIRMYSDMVLEQEESTNLERIDFSETMTQQLSKLEFLIDSLIKTSYLESNIINLSKENEYIFQTIILAMNGIVTKADKKNIELNVSCKKDIRVMHDIKWTSEALENIMDNAVKYTDKNGNISVDVFTGEMYTEIKITDSGKGIDSKYYNDIFKRFYRGIDTSNTEGLGLGLYLSRKIITLQGGHITVDSKPSCGTSFHVFLPN